MKSILYDHGSIQTSKEVFKTDRSRTPRLNMLLWVNKGSQEVVILLYTLALKQSSRGINAWWKVGNLDFKKGALIGFRRDQAAF